MTKRRAAGRPAKLADAEYVAVRLPAADRRRLEAIAARRGETVSDVLRDAVMAVVVADDDLPARESDLHTTRPIGAPR